MNQAQLGVDVAAQDITDRKRAETLQTPVASEPDRDEASQPAASVRDSNNRFALAVLVIEDEESLRAPVCKLLRRNGFSVIEASDGAASVDIFRARQSDIGVVLLDLTLPGLSGPEVLWELKRIQPEVRIIITTAYSRESAIASIGGLQTWAFIRKPYQLADLMQVLRCALAT